jgi:hypothetical protein
MTKTRWLSRRIGRLGPYLALCLSHDEFRTAVAHLKSADIPRWMNAGADATTHTFEHERQGTVCIVCLVVRKGQTPVEIAGLLVHEAVHVWQQWCKDVGERHPGDEQEAYAVQHISQDLMSEYARRLNG